MRRDARLDEELLFEEALDVVRDRESSDDRELEELEAEEGWREW